MSTRYFKSTITSLPTYIDGYFNVYEITDDGGVFPTTQIKLVLERVPYRQLSISDRLRLESNQKDVELTNKLRTAEYSELTSNHYLEIDGKFHKVFNVYHFTNNEGYRETDITLQSYNKGVEIVDDKD